MFRLSEDLNDVFDCVEAAASRKLPIQFKIGTWTHTYMWTHVTRWTNKHSSGIIVTEIELERFKFNQSFARIEDVITARLRFQSAGATLHHLN